MFSRRRPVLAAVLALAVLLSAGCTSDESPDRDTPGDPVDPEDPQAQGEGVPFELDIHRIRMVNADNAEIRGVQATPADHEAAERAVEAARSNLEAFLDAQFVDEETRFSGEPIAGLLTPRAQASLTDGDRAGLGAIDTPVARTFTGPTSAVAQVVLEGSATHLVHLWYVTKLRAEFDDGTTTPVDQRGSMTFVPTEEGWRVEAVEVDLQLPEAPAEPAESAASRSPASVASTSPTGWAGPHTADSP